MSRLPDDFHQDRVLRDAAREVLMADVEHAKATISGKSIAGRVAGRMGDGAKDVYEVAKVHAADRQGLIAGLMAIIALWFAREPLAHFLGSQASGVDEDEDEGESPNINDGADQASEATPDADTAEVENLDEDDANDITATTAPTDPQMDGAEPLSTGETA